ncbi:MAG: hypothetical protein ACAH88_10505 [Roseimicrobium sp.]
MAITPKQELVWQGRIHIGDEPGIFGDAHYNGLGTELPLTVFRADMTSTADFKFEVVVDTQLVETFTGYPGHAITVTVFEPDPNVQYHAVERVVARATIQSSDNNQKKVEVPFGTGPGPLRLSVGLRVDTSVNPGFYNDFVFVRLSLLSANAYASFGFDA